MSDVSQLFRGEAKVILSPDKMRAWISLPPPAGGPYTAEAVAEWLPANGVVYGADAGMIRRAVDSGTYGELLEVARGTMPVEGQGGTFVLKIDGKPFTGLRAAGDGALLYDDLSFLQEAQPQQVLAELIPGIPAQNGMTVTGESIPPRGAGGADKTLSGSGFAVSGDGRFYLAPCLSHVSMAGEQLVVTPLKKIAGLSEADGPFSFDGNVVVTGDVTAGASLTAGGSIYVAGRAAACHIQAGNNVLLCTGMRGGGVMARVQAKGHVWGQCFESCQIKAGGDVCANHLAHCEVECGGRASILGGRASITATDLHAKNGVVTDTLGGEGGRTLVVAGLDKEFIGRYASVGKRIDRLGIDIQALQQHITAHERVNRAKPDRGRGDAAYKDMIKKREQNLSVLHILNAERTRLKRAMDQATAVSVVARKVALPGTTVEIDSRTMLVQTPMKRTRFRRREDVIEATVTGG